MSCPEPVNVVCKEINSYLCVVTWDYPVGAIAFELQFFISTDGGVSSEIYDEMKVPGSMRCAVFSLTNPQTQVGNTAWCEIVAVCANCEMSMKATSNDVTLGPPFS